MILITLFKLSLISAIEFDGSLYSVVPIKFPERNLALLNGSIITTDRTDTNSNNSVRIIKKDDNYNMKIDSDYICFDKSKPTLKLCHKESKETLWDIEEEQQGIVFKAGKTHKHHHDEFKYCMSTNSDGNIEMVKCEHKHGNNQYFKLIPQLEPLDKHFKEEESSSYEYSSYSSSDNEKIHHKLNHLKHIRSDMDKSSKPINLINHILSDLDQSSKPIHRGDHFVFIKSNLQNSQTDKHHISGHFEAKNLKAEQASNDPYLHHSIKPRKYAYSNSVTYVKNVEPIHRFDMMDSIFSPFDYSAMQDVTDAKILLHNLKASKRIKPERYDELMNHLINNPAMLTKFLHDQGPNFTNEDLINFFINGSGILPSLPNRPFMYDYIPALDGEIITEPLSKSDSQNLTADYLNNNPSSEIYNSPISRKINEDQTSNGVNPLNPYQNNFTDVLDIPLTGSVFSDYDKNNVDEIEPEEECPFLK